MKLHVDLIRLGCHCMAPCYVFMVVLKLQALDLYPVKELPCCLHSAFHGIGTEWYVLWHSLKPRHSMWEAFTHPL